MNKQTRSMFEDSVVVARLQDESALMLMALQQVARDLRRFRISAGSRTYYSARLDETKAQIERIIDHMEGRKPEIALGALSARLSKIMRLEDAEVMSGDPAVAAKLTEALQIGGEAS